MTMTLTIHTNEDDALIAWQPDGMWPTEWIGFKLEKKNVKTGEVTVVNNRIPAKLGDGQTPAAGVRSDTSPFRRCMWTDHAVAPLDQLQYRVTPMVDGQDGGFVDAPDGTSDWTAAAVTSGVDDNGLAAHFNRGTLMSQIVSRFVDDNVTAASLKTFKASLADPAFAPRRYLSGHAREALLRFLADADRRGSHVYAAVYEFNDAELIAALKVFGGRASILLGNGDGMKPDLASELSAAGLDVHQRDLSKHGRSSPSVHNKFVIEVSPAGIATRVLTGSLNWTTTGLCTQLNNALIIERLKIADRYLTQWRDLVAAGNEMPPTLKASNADWLTDGPVSVAYAATTDQQDFAPVLDAIASAKDAIFFLMFMPGESPLLKNAMDRSAEAGGPFVRGVVSTVVTTKNGTITHVGGQVVENGVTKPTDDDVILPNGLPAANRPTWAFDEFNRSTFTAVGLIAIVHSKTIVIDPFSDDCVVVTGSHNFSVSASAKNDENIVVVKGDKALAQAYAVHIQGVYDAYAWRNFLQTNGDPMTLYQGLANWQPGGSHARELDFWVKG